MRRSCRAATTGTPTLRRAAGAVAAAALGLGAVSGCAYVDSNPGLEVGAPGAQAGVTIDRILEEPWYVNGRTVTVEGVVTGTPAETAMTIAGTPSGTGPLLVVHEPGYDPVEGDGVRVTGVVGEAFDRRAVAAELGVDDLGAGDADALARFASEPYLTATSIDDVAR